MRTCYMYKFGNGRRQYCGVGHEILDSARETDRRYVELTRKEAREEGEHAQSATTDESGYAAPRPPVGDGARSRTVLRLCTKHNC